MLLCQHCNKQFKNPGGLGAHEPYCKFNPSKVKRKRSPNAGIQKGSIPWNKGLRGDERCAHSEETKKKLGKSFKGKSHTLESRQKMSESRKKLYANGWECVAGRCLKYDYESPIAGKVKVDGSWELKFCEFADKVKLNWSRNKKRFSYTKPNGKKSTYQPDFYLKDFDCYIEVKGYETDLDKIKWSQFPKKLIVLRKKEIGELDEWFKSLLC